jgi:hypothetical protein
MIKIVTELVFARFAFRLATRQPNNRCHLSLSSKSSPAPTNVGAVHVEEIYVDPSLRDAKRFQLIRDSRLHLTIGGLADTSNTIEAAKSRRCIGTSKDNRCVVRNANSC